jgi:hypothetical protein
MSLEQEQTNFERPFRDYDEYLDSGGIYPMKTITLLITSYIRKYNLQPIAVLIANNSNI